MPIVNVFVFLSKKKIQVKVNIQLYRPGDEAISEPVEFRYKPINFNLNINRKRPRVASFYDSDIPVVVTENTFARNPADNYVPQMNDMNDDTDIEQMLSDLFTNTPNELGNVNPEGNFDQSIDSI